MLHKATATLSSVSPYSQSGFFKSDKPQKMTHEEFERENWREKMHVNSDGNVFIPPMAFKKSLEFAAKMLSIPIPGKGKSLYTKHFKSGVLVVNPIVLPIKSEAVDGEWIHANADGRSGSGTRVKRCFPVIQSWSAEVEFLVLDETINEEVFRKVLIESGQLVGIGRFRPENGGFYGRFAVDSMEWTEAA